jgi:hypothetical protein
MRRLLTPTISILVLLFASVGPAVVITVDADGGADYVTIQEAVDVAANSDTVLVYPGTYTGSHYCEWQEHPTCVCLHSEVTLMSAEGPDETFIDVVEPSGRGVCSDYALDVVVEGFTFTCGGGAGDPSAVAINLEQGEVRGNVISGFGAAVSTWPPWLDYRGPAGQPGRQETVIEANTLTGNGTGVGLFLSGASTVAVVDNVITDNTGSGVNARGVGDLSIVGNEISRNLTGVSLTNPSHTVGVQFEIEMFGNTIIDSEHNNVDVWFVDVGVGTVCDLTLGGDIGSGNDIYGAGWYNVEVESESVAVFVDATYNYWGSTVCADVVPMFRIHDTEPSPVFSFEPFVDETHTSMYDCQAVPAHESSWGALKALYR